MSFSYTHSHGGILQDTFCTGAETHTHKDHTDKHAPRIHTHTHTLMLMDLEVVLCTGTTFGVKLWQIMAFDLTLL